MIMPFGATTLIGSARVAGITLDGVSKVFAGGVQAVDNVSLEIGDGEFMVLVGPSGCGKSTTLRMVAGLEETTGGEIWIGDRLVNEIAPRDRDIAMVFQNYALYPHMSVTRIWRSGSKCARRRRPRLKERVREAARFFRPRACSIASRGSFRAGSGSAWRWGGRSFASRSVFV